MESVAKMADSGIDQLLLQMACTLKSPEEIKEIQSTEVELIGTYNFTANLSAQEITDEIDKHFSHLTQFSVEDLRNLVIKDVNKKIVKAYSTEMSISEFLRKCVLHDEQRQHKK